MGWPFFSWSVWSFWRLFSMAKFRSGVFYSFNTSSWLVFSCFQNNIRSGVMGKTGHSSIIFLPSSLWSSSMSPLGIWSNISNQMSTHNWSKLIFSFSGSSHLMDGAMDRSLVNRYYFFSLLQLLFHPSHFSFRPLYERSDGRVWSGVVCLSFRILYFVYWLYPFSCYWAPLCHDSSLLRPPWRNLYHQFC